MTKLSFLYFFLRQARWSHSGSAKSLLSDISAFLRASYHRLKPVTHTECSLILSFFLFVIGLADNQQTLEKDECHVHALLVLKLGLT